MVGGGGAGGWCRLRRASLLGCSFRGIGTYCVKNNIVLVVQIVLALIHIRSSLTIDVHKILHTIWYLYPCNETPEGYA